MLKLPSVPKKILRMREHVKRSYVRPLRVHRVQAKRHAVMLKTLPLNVLLWRHTTRNNRNVQKANVYISKNVPSSSL
jgi:hypothetical protein